MSMSRKDASQISTAGGSCSTCGKRMYATKAEAKRRAKAFLGRQGKLRAYRCGHAWHLGHLPPFVVSGEESRDVLRKDAP